MGEIFFITNWATFGYFRSVATGNQRPYCQTPVTKIRVSFSPDGKWIAYRSPASGRYEVYIFAFPSSAGKWQVPIGWWFSALAGRWERTFLYIVRQQNDGRRRPNIGHQR